MAVDMEPSDDRSSSSMSMSATVATKKSDVSDIELKELSNYFSKSKEEIQKVNLLSYFYIFSPS